MTVHYYKLSWYLHNGKGIIAKRSTFEQLLDYAQAYGITLFVPFQRKYIPYLTPTEIIRLVNR